MGHGNDQDHQRPERGYLIEGDPQPAEASHGQPDRDERDRKQTQRVGERLETEPQQKDRYGDDDREEEHAVLHGRVVAVEFEQDTPKGVNPNARVRFTQGVAQCIDGVANRVSRLLRVRSRRVFHNRQRHVPAGRNEPLGEILIGERNVADLSQISLGHSVEHGDQIVAPVTLRILIVQTSTEQRAHRNRTVDLRKSRFERLHRAQCFEVEDVRVGLEDEHHARAWREVGAGLFNLLHVGVAVTQNRARSRLGSGERDSPRHDQRDDDGCSREQVAAIDECSDEV